MLKIKKHLMFIITLILYCFCMYSLIGCKSVQVSKVNKAKIESCLKSSVLKPVAGESLNELTDKIRIQEILKADLVNEELYKNESRAGPVQESTLDKIFNIGVLFIIIIVLIIIYKVFRAVGLNI